MKACVIGLGQVGLPTALYLADRGVNVWGYNISEEAVRRGRNTRINATMHWNEIPQIDIYVVCVSTSMMKNGPDLRSFEKGLDFYRDFLEIPLHLAPSVEMAEMSKIAENAYRYVQIALAEELSMIRKQSGLVFKDVRKACNTKWNTEIPKARTGIKGHCLPKDIRYLLSLGENNSLMESAMLVDNKYQQWLKSKKQPARPVVEPELSKN